MHAGSPDSPSPARSSVPGNTGRASPGATGIPLAAPRQPGGGCHAWIACELVRRGARRRMRDEPGDTRNRAGLASRDKGGANRHADSPAWIALAPRIHAPVRTNEVTLRDALSEARGARDNAGRVAYVLRAKPRSDEPQPLEVDLDGLFRAGQGGGVMLEPGDSVYVPEASTFYVSGEVEKR